jgi:hypothetical protein
MPRPHLVRVAQSINGRLPKALQIACGDDLHDADIRRAIEVLVGIRAESTRCSAQVMGLPSVPPTNSTSADMDADSSAMDLDDQRSIVPSSPLSIRGRPLDILKEEQEHEEPLEERRSSSPEDTPGLVGPVSAASCSRLIENLDMSASRLLSSDSIEYVRPVTNTQENFQRQRSTRLSSRSPQPREVVIRLPFTSPPKAQPTLILRSHSHRASTTSASSQVSSLRRVQSDASAMLKRSRYHFRRGRATSKVVDHFNLPEVEEESHALPISTGSALVNFLAPRPRGESVSTTVSREKGGIQGGAVRAMGEIVV